MEKLKVVFSVILGITTTLLLTLELWGNEFHKLAFSILIGTGIGLLIEYRKTTKILSGYLKKPLIGLEKEEQKKLASDQAQEIISLILALTILLSLLIYYSPIIFQRDPKGGIDHAFIISLLISLAVYIYVAALFTFKWWAKLLLKKEQIEIWGLTLTGQEKMANFNNKGLKALKMAIWQSFRKSFPRLAVFILVKIGAVIISSITLFYSLIADAIMLPFVLFILLFKSPENNKADYLLLLLMSTTIGIVWTFRIGLMAGISLFIITFIIKRVNVKMTPASALKNSITAKAIKKIKFI